MEWKIFSISGQLTGEPPAKRLNILGTPNHTSTPHLASKGTPKSTPKNVNTPDSGLPSSYGSKLSNSAVLGNSPNLKPSVNKRRLSIGTPQQTLLKCILKPGGTANQTPKSAASKSMNLSNGRLQLSASTSKGNTSVNGILKPGGTANQTPKSTASKSMNLSNGRLQLPASASKGNTSVNGILKPGGTAHQTPKSAASKSMNLSNGRLQLPASASKGNTSVNGSPQVSHNR